MVKGSFEALEWLDTMGPYKRRLPPIVQQIYDFRIYRKLVETCNQEQMYEFHTSYVRSYGWTAGLHQFTRDLKMKRSYEQGDKDRFIEQQLKQEKVSIEQLEEKIKEEEKINSMSPEERAQWELREKQWPEGMYMIPLSVHQQQPILEKNIDSEGIGYIIYDKIYQSYACAVWSPMRRRPDGVTGVVLLRSRDMDGIKRQLYGELITEAKKYHDWLANRPKTKEPDISHVKKIMNIDDLPTTNRLNNSDLNGDIF